MFKSSLINNKIKPPSFLFIYSSSYCIRSRDRSIDCICRCVHFKIKYCKFAQLYIHTVPLFRQRHTDWELPSLDLYQLRHSETIQNVLTKITDWIYRNAHLKTFREIISLPCIFIRQMAPTEQSQVPIYSQS